MFAPVPAFAAFADDTRMQIVEALATDDRSVTELVELFPISQPAISKHLRVLEEAGLVSRRRAAQARPTALRPEALDEADAWIEMSRAVWRGRMERLDIHLKERNG